MRNVGNGAQVSVDRILRVRLSVVWEVLSGASALGCGTQHVHKT